MVRPFDWKLLLRIEYAVDVGKACRRNLVRGDVFTGIQREDIKAANDLCAVNMVAVPGGFWSTYWYGNHIYGRE